MILLRFLVPLVLSLCLVTYLLGPWAGQLFLGWAQTDIQIRSRLVFASLEDGLTEALESERRTKIIKKFNQLVDDERLIGIGFCTDLGVPRYHNKDYPTDVTCPSMTGLTKPEFKPMTIKGGPVMIAMFPVNTPDAQTYNGKSDYILIVHDMSYAELRGERTKQYMLLFVLGISVLASLITVVVARVTFSRWVLGLRDYVRTGKRSRALPRETIGLARDIQQRIRQIERESQYPQLGTGQWSSDNLFDFVRDHLPSEQIISVSYRQPYAHSRAEDGTLTWSVPASGLVTAIEPIMKACRGTWIAAGTSDVDKQAADENGALMVPPERPSYRLKRLWLEQEEEAGFYFGLANEGLWPLCNMAYVKPHFRSADWSMYKKVNQIFADAIVAEAKSSAPIVFIQDYHFGMLPRMVRDRLPDALIVVFWHIPWPNSETLSILPWREEFLDGLLAADIIGFHTQFHCNNFLDCVDSYMEALIDREHNTVRHGEDFCMVRPYPISIAWPDFETLDIPDAPACRKEIIKKLNLDPANKIILGVERLDYIKGIPERLNAYGIFLDRNPDWRGKVCFVQIASPSRSIIPAYENIDREIERIVTDINERFGTKTWKPVHILKRNFNQNDVYRFYRAADACIVSSLHDGMNLVAKEFVSARDDEQGVLILSQFSGSSRELVDSIIVNPYDEETLAQSLLRALSMSETEQAARMRSMREHIKTHNVFAWAAQILGDAAKLYRRRQLNNLLQTTITQVKDDDETETAE